MRSLRGLELLSIQMPPFKEFHVLYKIPYIDSMESHSTTVAAFVLLCVYIYHVGFVLVFYCVFLSNG